MRQKTKKFVAEGSKDKSLSGYGLPLFAPRVAVVCPGCQDVFSRRFDASQFLLPTGHLLLQMAIPNPSVVHTANLKWWAQPQYVDIVTPSAHCTPFFPPAEILCIVFGLLFVLDHKVPPQKVRRRRKKTKKRKASGPSSASGQQASASRPTTLQAVR